ncbi:RDD family protein [Aeromicrobium wangtongii]|uniref:RDD family protein n=1 Tax=Aeromicrobium wangtongii TaxID=2969247 RepID=A0ABY5MH47_9ACTN|nr:RDD family protein [Aeromicrobium wangtongii]MCD9197722.1 RDD family protein [Aeromicrobium wangtongii]UUP15206.1 RDD family protein [Aeromicrobium wangtongii]
MTDPTTTDRSVRELRREALWQDTLLFSAAFSLGAVLYVAFETIRLAIDDDASGDFWSVSMSDHLVLTGLVVGELFVLVNNGLRQGVRGHSIGKHRVGLAVVDVGTGRPAGAARGLLRGLVTVVLLDLALAAIPIGLPTVLRRLTPEAWHVGGAAYVALLVLLVPLLLSSDRGLADRIAGTEVVRGVGAQAITTEERSKLVGLIEAAGVIGLLTVAIVYIAFFAQLLHFPDLF